MIDTPVIHALMAHRSIRRYTDAAPSDEVVKTIVRAGQQAPFAYQMGSVLLSRKRERNPFGAPLLFTICVDALVKTAFKLEPNVVMTPIATRAIDATISAYSTMVAPSSSCHNALSCCNMCVPLSIWIETQQLC